MEAYFKKFRDHTIGNELILKTPFGDKQMIYADWIASGRLYRPIEKKMADTFGPYVGNTHTETSETGTLTTKAYHYAHQLIKEHVNADASDVIITTGFGMTGVINKFQRILGLKYCGKVAGDNCLNENEKPVVFITHMEHHSNQTSWFETMVDLVVIPPGDDLLVDLDKLKEALEKYKDRKKKYGAFTACSNVTGVVTPIHEMARLMHAYGGYCFVDYAASAPYVDINMHPEDPKEKLDAIFFSPHKFLGGPGSSGVMIFCSSIYKNPVPDNPGGGTVDWTNPWGEYKYIDNIEVREDGGTPGFLQAIRTALSIQVKNQMGTENIHKREKQLVSRAFEGMRKIKGMHILADNVENRLGIISFYVDHVHYNLLVKLLNDRYGIQVRGGCACAGTYGHYLLNVTYEDSHEITQRINSGDLSVKPGWVRLSLHPTMTDKELNTFIEAVDDISQNIESYKKEYIYNKKINEFKHISELPDKTQLVRPWFKLEES